MKRRNAKVGTAFSSVPKQDSTESTDITGMNAKQRFEVAMDYKRAFNAEICFGCSFFL